MMRTRKRVRSMLLAVAVAASVAPVLSAPAAHAAGVLQGAASVSPSTGSSGTNFTVSLPSGAACGQDSSNGGYRVQSYMVPASVDPTTLTFDVGGPTPQGVGASFRQPLYDTSGSPFVNAQTADASTAGGPGPIINIPTFNLQLFSPGDIPPGAYNLGIACTLGPASATQMKEFWNTTLTFSTNGGDGFANVNYSVGAVPSAPTLSSLTPGDASLEAAFTPGASTPAATSYTVSATPSAGGATFTASGAESPITVTGLVNGTQYDVTVHATNSVGNSVESNILQGTPNPAARPAVQNLQATPSTGSVNVTWDAPTGPAPTGYLLEVSPADAGPFSLGAGTTSQNVTGLTAGTAYTFTVTPQHPAPYVGTADSVQATPFSSQVLLQELEVTRPVGALVLTQVCGAYGALDAEAASPGFAALPALTADSSGAAAPVTSWPGSTQDPNYGEYPYPVDENEVPNATYPTHCGVNLGKGKFVTSGSGGGQFFAAHGRLNQLTVVDTRDTDDGWTVNGTVTDFTTTGDSFSGNHLGWTPKKTTDTGPFDHDLDPGTAPYDQNASAGAAVAARTLSGLGSGRTLGSAAAGSGLGIAVFDGRLKLLIPVTARNGVYTATLSFTTV